MSITLIISLVSSVVLPVIFFGVRWWLKRSAFREGRESVERENMEGEIEAHAKAHEADSNIHADTSLKSRMRDALRRRG